MTCKDCDLNYYPCEGEKTIKRLEAENKKFRDLLIWIRKAEWILLDDNTIDAIEEALK